MLPATKAHLRGRPSVYLFEGRCVFVYPWSCAEQNNLPVKTVVPFSVSLSPPWAHSAGQLVAYEKPTFFFHVTDVHNSRMALRLDWQPPEEGEEGASSTSGGGGSRAYTPAEQVIYFLSVLLYTRTYPPTHTRSFFCFSSSFHAEKGLWHGTCDHGGAALSLFPHQV